MMQLGQWVYFNTPPPEDYPADKWTYDRYGVVLHDLGDGVYYVQMISIDDENGRITADSGDSRHVSEHMVETLTDEEVSQRIGTRVTVTVNHG
jgi:hypothetical protein